MAERRAGLSLGTRIVLITSVLIVLAVGVAVVATYVIGERIARQSVEEALDRSARAQEGARNLYQEQLENLSARLRDPDLVAYFAEAVSLGDTLSLLDQLEERQNEFGFDFAIALDPEGRVICRTDRPGAAGGEDLAGDPLVAEALERLDEVTGIRREGGLLYNTVAVPMQVSFDLSGYLVVGYRITDELAKNVSASSGTEVAFLSLGAENTRVIGTSGRLGGLEQELLDELEARNAFSGLAGGGKEERLEVTLGGEPWAALLTPLTDAAGTPVGATVALASLDAQLGPYREILLALVAAGGVSILLGIILSYLLSRRTLGPVRRLAVVAEAARQGDYDQEVAVERRDEVGRMAQAFDALLRDLREKRDMEAYVAQLARNLPDAGGAGAGTAAAGRQVTLVAAELRRYARARTTSDPEATVDRLARDLRRAAAAASAQRGRLEAVSGHRLLASFEGDGKSHRALSAAAQMLSDLSTPEDAFDEPEPPLVALASGEVVRGSVVLEDGPDPALLGPPVQKLEGLMREATAGELILSREVYRELEESLGDAGIEVAAIRGVVTPLPMYPLTPEQASRVTGVSVEPRRTVAPAAEGRATLAGIGPGTLFGDRFEILSVLGSGGMGVVYKARDRELGEPVALKMLKRDLWQDPVQLTRLKEELRLARKITHPNVLRTYDFGELDGIPFISMEYVRGITLRTLLDQTDRLPFSAGLRLAKQLCAGLGAAHAVGVIHRDIKPENVIVEPTGNSKLMDFGIARPVARGAEGLTQEGWIVGTPQYLAPEQLRGEGVDHRADLYACGVVLYEIFTGAIPFPGANPMQIATRHLQEEPPPPGTHWPEIPDELERIILTCLAKSPDGRFPDAATLQHHLEGLSA